MPDYYRFPADFLWGCATASYQVEERLASRRMAGGLSDLGYL